jgi:predicted DNA-binding protein (UPF0251 family)
MPRPRKCRKIRGDFDVFYYKPKGVGLSQLEQVDLELDEIEAIRLVDAEGLSMEEAAVSMKISKPTVCRVVNSARQKLADAVCNGKAISIQNYFLTNTNMPNNDGTGPEGKGPKTGRQMGKCEGAKPAGSGARGRRGAGNGRGPGLGRRGRR